jgi:RND family efflux transporter MFP subunit
MKSKPWIIGGSILGLALAGGGGWYVWSQYFNQDEEAPPPAVRLVKTQVANLHPGGDVVMQTGEVCPARHTDLAFQIGGKLLRREVEIGAKVVSGQVIAALEDIDVQNEMRIGQSDLASAETSLKLTMAEMDRSMQLLKSNAIAKADAETATANWESAESKVKAAQAALDNIKRKLGYTKLVASQDGVVIAVGANSGEVVGAGQLVARIAVGNDRDAVFDVAERIAASTPEDVVVQLALVSNPSIVATGRVREYSPTADPATRTYRVKIGIKDAPEEMSFGATVIGKVELRTGDQVTLPAAAITRDANEPAVYVVEPKDNTLLLKKVNVARYSEGSAYIIDGVTDGDRVVVAGVSKLRPGQKVLTSEVQQ